MSIATNTQMRIPPSTLGKRLEDAREWRNLSQLEVAETLDVSRATISNYERGVTTPSRLQVNAWAAFCDVDVEWIKTGTVGTPDGTDPKRITVAYNAHESNLDNVTSLTGITRKHAA